MAFIEGELIRESQIQEWQNSPSENENLEFKEAKNNFDRRKLYKYLVALANEFGGYFVLGMTDKAPREIVGTNAFPDLPEIKKEIRANTRLNVDVHEFDVGGKRIVAFQAPPRPKGTAYEYKGAYFMRCGEDLLPMSEDRLRHIFNEKDDWEMEFARESLTVNDVHELLEVQAYFQLVGRTLPDDLEEQLRPLVDDRLLVRQATRFGLTNTAAILLAKDLRQFPSLERKAPRLIVYKDNSKLSPQRDLTGKKGYAAGFQALVKSCMTYLPQNEVIEDALRKTVPLISEEPLREVIANSLIHQDFSESGAGPLVEIYSNRIVVSNPGSPILPVERFIDSHKSRNERIATAMRRMKICEERSSGIDRLISTAELLQLPAPEFRVGFDSTIVVIHGPRTFAKMTAEDKIRACYQHCVLKWVMSEQMTNESLCLRFGLTENDSNKITKIIKNTVDAGFVVNDPSVGASRKYARYVPKWTI